MNSILNKFFIVLCLLLAQQAFASAKEQGPLSVTLVWNGTDSLTKKATFDSLKKDLISHIKNMKTLHYVPFDSIKFASENDLLTYYSNHYQPVDLHRSNKNFDVNLILYCTPQFADPFLTLTIRAIDFMTGDDVDHVNLQLSNAASGRKIVRTAFDGLIKNILSQKSVFGFPFAQDDFGIVLLGKETPDSLLQHTIQLLRKASEELAIAKKLRFKFISTNSTGDSCQDFCTIGREVNRLLRASAGLCLNNADTLDTAIFVLPTTDLSQPAINVELPVHPPIHELYCLPVKLDTVDVEEKLAAILGEHISSISTTDSANGNERELLPLLFAKATRAQSIWENNSYAENDDPDDSSLVTAIEECYQRLGNLVADSSVISGWIHLNYADFRFLAGDSDSALTLMQVAEEAFSRAHDTTGLLLTSIEYGKIFNFVQNYGRAQEAFTTAIAMTEQRRDSVSIAQIGYNLGMLAEMQSDNEKALSYYEKSAKLFNTIGDPYKTCQIYGHLARLLRNSNQFDDSRDYAQGYLRMAKELRSEPLTAKAHFQLGLVLLAQDNLKGAIEQFQHAADYMEILGDSSGLARVDNNLGAIYQELSDWGQAQMHFESALKLSRASGDMANTIRSLVNLGDLAADQKKWDEAQTFYDKAEENARTLNSDHELAIVVYAKGLAHLREGRLKTGYGEIKRAIELGGGSVHEDAEKEQAFLKKLETLIGEIQDIQSK